MNACVNGTCTAGVPVTEISCCGNGILDPGEQCDDGNQFSGDACPSTPIDDCQFGSSHSLIRGTKLNPARDTKGCQVEWYVRNPTNPPDHFGLPTREQVCLDGDPTCDLDPRPGHCRFEVVVCANNSDPNLTRCIPNGIDHVDVLPLPARLYRLPIIGQLAQTNTDKVKFALQHLLDPANPGAGYVVAPPLSVSQQGFCSAPMLIDVLSGSSYRRESVLTRMKFKARSADTNTRRAKKVTAQLRLTCKARPLP